MNSGRELRVVFVADRNDVPLARDEWNRLAAANEISTVFQTYEWFDCWWKTFGTPGRLAFLAVYRSGQIIGFAALMSRHLFPGLAQLQFVGAGNADYQDIVASTEDKREVVAAICAFLKENSKSWDRIQLSNIPAHSSTLDLLRDESAMVGIRLLREAVEPCPALSMEAEADRQATVQRIAKYSLRRPTNWFRRQGTLEFRRLTEWAEINRLLPSFFEQHVRRWALAGKQSQFVSTGERQFYVSLAQAAYEGGWLYFSVVEFNGRPLAFHFGFDNGRVVTWYKPSFDVAYSQHSPGLVLIRCLIDEALKSGHSEIDFTIGGEPFKERFANRQRQNVYVSLYRAGMLWSLAVAVRAARRRGRLMTGIFRSK